MVARYSGAFLGLLAFATTTVGGLYVGNPPYLILSRSILALFLFCMVGFFLGLAAQAVVTEFERSRKDHIERQFRPDAALRAEETPKASGVRS